MRSVADGAGATLPFAGPIRLVGDGLEYVVHDTATRSRTICVAYTGRYPVFSRLNAATDFKGEIAFTGQTMRAAEQTKWYPVLYDSASGRLAVNVSYDLDLQCPECDALYLNGSPPVTGPAEHFVSAAARPLLLFAGDFQFQQEGGTWFLGADLPRQVASQFGAGIARIKAFEASVTGLPFRDSLVLIQHSALNQSHRRGTWGFTTWPTIAVAGTPLADLGRSFAGHDTTKAWVPHFLAHELGHYYFGYLLAPRGPYRWFYVESTAEYLSLLATRALRGEPAYLYALQVHWRKAARLRQRTALDRIAAPDAIGETYRYDYAPLLLVALGERIGVERMGRALHAVLTAPDSVPRDYALLRTSVLGTGVAAETWTRFEAECIAPEPSRSCLRLLPGLADSTTVQAGAR